MRILHIVPRLGYAGLEAVVMNYYRHIDTKEIQFDFVVGMIDNERYIDEIASHGGIVHRVPPRANAPISYMRALAKILRENKYEIIHIHGNSASMLMEAVVAKRCGIRTIIGHSHNTKSDTKWQHYLLRPFVNLFLTNRFACSEEAGKWAFGKRADVRVVNNAIDLTNFHFDEHIRSIYRKELGIENKFTIGFVGRLQEQKNPMFLVKIFEKLYKKNKEAVLLVVGEGKMQNQMKEYAEANGFSSAVIFLGKRDDVPQLMSAMDVFLLPSIFEGLGLVAVEAMASGLPCLVSDRVPCPNITGRLKTISLDMGGEIWVDALMNIEQKSRNNVSEFFRQSGYDINSEAEKLSELYYETCK